MCKRIIPFTFSLLFVVAAMAQDFARVKFTAPHGPITTSRVPCSDNQLGSISGFGPITSINGGPGMSNSTPTANDVTYLCFEDQFSIIYDESGVQLNGDPNTGTDGGVAYIAYNRDPNSPAVEDGPNIATILNDNSVLLNNPADVQSIIFAADALLNGNETFENKILGNGQSVPETFSPNGEPIQIWYAPISVDAYDAATNEVIYEGTPAGECVTVDLAEAFSVVYLNPIEFVTNANNLDIVYPFGGVGNRARFQVTGGLPEFTNSENYTITITNTSDASITGQVVNGPAANESFAEIEVPTPGTYTIEISDGRSCSVSQTLLMDQFQPSAKDLDISVIAPLGASVGQEFCADIVVENFDSIEGIELYMCWDTEFLDFTRSTNVINGGSDWLFGEESTDAGAFLANFFTIAPTNFPDGSVLFSLCFVPKKVGTSTIEFCKTDPRPNTGSNQGIPGNIILTENGQSKEIFLSSDPGNDSDPITITDPDALNVILLNDEIKHACPGRNNAGFAIQVVGGIPPYQGFATNTATGMVDGPLMILDQDGTGAFAGLPPGEYTYEVFDGAAVPDTKLSGSLGPITLNEVDLALLPLEITIPTCRNDTNGVFGITLRENASPVDDLSNYSFFWIERATGDTISKEETAINLIAGGIYDVTVTNNNGCTSPAIANVANPREINPGNAFITDAFCTGSENGSIAINNASGGIGNLSYSWEHDPTLTQSTANNLDPGEYTYTITDDNGCDTTETVQVDTDVILNIDVNIPRTELRSTCFGLDNATIAVNSRPDVPASVAATLNGPYQFTWSTNAPTPTNLPNGSEISMLQPDSFTVVLSHPDLQGCMATRGFRTSEPDTLLIQSITITDVTSCNLTTPDGGASAVVTGGTEAYQYAWDTMGVSIGNTMAITDKPAGMLTLTVEDDKGCITTKDTIIGTPPPPVIDFFNPVDLPCATDVASLTVAAVPGRSGVTPLTYQWAHAPSLTGDTGNDLSPGKYYVTVVDADGCASTDSSEVTAPPIIRTSAVDFLKEPCFETEDGSMSVALAGGVSSNYRISWNVVGGTAELGTSEVLTNVGAGAYELSVLDDNNCPFDTIINLNNIPKIEVAFDNVTGVDCFDTVNPADCNGAASATAAYEGVGGGAFTFTWEATNETSGATTNMFSSNILCAGMQKIMVSDGTCTVTDSVNIDSPPQLAIDEPNSSFTAADCFGDTNGEASLVAMGGTGGYSFEWPDGGTETTKTDLAADTYVITITDANNCIATHEVIITQPDAALTASIDPNNTNGVICAGDADGLITVLVEGGNQGTINYTWTNNVSNINSAAGLSPGSYNIVATDSKGCTDDTDFLVEEPEPITAMVDFGTIPCFGFETNIRISSPMGGNGNNYSFSVDNSPVRPADESIRDFGGDKLISLFDSTGCRQDLMVTIPQPRELLVGFAEEVVEVDLGSSIPIELLIDGDVPVADIFWTQDGGVVNDSIFSCIGVLCDNPTVNPLNNTLYTASVTDANGCMSEASIQVEVDKNRNIYIPNVFAPNNAGFDTNDRFGVFTGSGVSKINYAKVFNRWGTMVADIPETRVQGIGEVVQVWDGQIKGQKANQGTYIYIIEVEFIDGQILLYRGDVTLLR